MKGIVPKLVCSARSWTSLSNTVFTDSHSNTTLHVVLLKTNKTRTRRCSLSSVLWKPAHCIILFINFQKIWSGLSHLFRLIRSFRCMICWYSSSIMFIQTELSNHNKKKLLFYKIDFPHRGLTSMWTLTCHLSIHCV